MIPYFCGLQGGFLNGTEHSNIGKHNDEKSQQVHTCWEKNTFNISGIKVNSKITVVQVEYPLSKMFETRNVLDFGFWNICLCTMSYLPDGTQL